MRDNLFGLELDPRCSQIAAFNLALTAWKLAGRHFQLPPLNLACSGLGINAKEEDWVKLAGVDGRKQDLMRWLYSLFRNAPTLGSLIDPRRVGKPMVEDEIAGLLPLLEHALAAEHSTDETRELAIAAQGLLAAAHLLTERFTLVATNVPYLGRGKQDDTLKEFCGNFHSDAKADLATCLIDRCVRFCTDGGCTALVTKHEPLFQPRYESFRRRLLADCKWHFVVRLGAHAFETITGEVVKVALLELSTGQASAEHRFFGVDVSDEKTPAEKAAALPRIPGTMSAQRRQLKNPGAVVSFEELAEGGHLSNYACSYQGLSTADNPQFLVLVLGTPLN